MPADSLSKLSGRYSQSWANGDIGGQTFTSTDVIQIAPIGRYRAQVSMELNFFNGHKCTVFGPARLRGRKLVFRDHAYGEPKSQCRLEIWREHGKLRWEDGGTCQFHCGSRGGLSRGSMDASLRQHMGGPVVPPELH